MFSQSGVRKCIMCGSILGVYSPYYLVYSFYDKLRNTPILTSVSKISKLHYRTIIKPSIKRKFILKKYTKNKPTYYYCTKCYQSYTDNDGKPLYNFRTLSLRKNRI